MSVSSRILPATSYWSIDPEQPCKLRINSSSARGEECAPQSVLEILHSAAETYPDHPALVEPSGKIISYSDYERKVQHFAKVFIKIGLQSRHSVAVLAANCPEFFCAELSAIYADGIALGVYVGNSAVGVYHCLKESRANIVLVDDANQLEKVLAVRDKLPLLKAIVQIGWTGWDDGTSKTVEGLYSWSDLENIPVQDVQEEFEKRQSAIAINQAALLIFTSGTTGLPKGAMLSHDNIIWNARRYLAPLSAEMTKEVLISYLPLSHVAGQLEMFMMILCAGAVHFGDRDALKGSIVDSLIDCRPTFFAASPRVYEKICDRLTAFSNFNKQANPTLAKWANKVSLDYHTKGMAYAKWKYGLAQGLILNRLKGAIGLDRCKLIVCGSAPLSLQLKRYFLGMDMPVLDTYGMTESSGGITMAQVDANGKTNTIGKALPGGEITIMDDEICARGRNVFMGYIWSVEKTKEALDEDGWLHSGDMGYMCEEGFLYLTGRLKEMIITSGGENVPPVHVEHLVKSELACVSNVVLVGDHRKYLTMLLTLKTEVDGTGLPKDELHPVAVNWMREIGLDHVTVSEVMAAGPCPKVMAGIQAGIDRANRKAFSHAQRVQKFTIIDHEFSAATGELGPLLKVKRRSIFKLFAGAIDNMYE